MRDSVHIQGLWQVEILATRRGYSLERGEDTRRDDKEDHFIVTQSYKIKSIAVM